MLLLNEKDKIQFVEDYKKLSIVDICRKWNCGKVSVLETGRKLMINKKPHVKSKKSEYKVGKQD